MRISDTFLWLWLLKTLILRQNFIQSELQMEDTYNIMYVRSNLDKGMILILNIELLWKLYAYMKLKLDVCRRVTVVKWRYEQYIHTPTSSQKFL